MNYSWGPAQLEMFRRGREKDKASEKSAICLSMVEDFINKKESRIILVYSSAEFTNYERERERETET